jgi:hypothetical protein
MAWTTGSSNTGTVNVVNDLTHAGDTTDALSAAAGAQLQAEIDAMTVSVGGLASAINRGAEPHTLAITSAGQTAFTLPSTPTDPASLMLYLNGQAIGQAGTDFSLSGTALTWLNATVLATTDTLVALYK